MGRGIPCVVVLQMHPVRCVIFPYIARINTSYIYLTPTVIHCTDVAVVKQQHCS